MSGPRAIGLALCLLMITGCGRVVFRPSAPESITLSPEQQQTLAQQQSEFQNRATQLDRNNQELEAMLAQSRQETQLMREQMAATQDQLRITADQLASVQQEKTRLEANTQTMMASTQAPVAAGIRPNSTLLKPLNAGSLPGVTVRQDGDTIRVSISSDQLFAPGASQVKPGGDQLLRSVAADIMSHYPQQVIGIEGHTDNAPAQTSTHHLSVAQATAVYDVLTRAANVPAQQLFVIGHGANHPLMSNATEAGRQANRRIEVVVYPEVVRR